MSNYKDGISKAYILKQLLNVSDYRKSLPLGSGQLAVKTAIFNHKTMSMFTTNEVGLPHPLIALSRHLYLCHIRSQRYFLSSKSRSKN